MKYRKNKMDDYVSELIDVIGNICISDVDYKLPYADGIRKIEDMFIDVKNRKRSICFVGNGGSAAIANHMTVDFMKNGRINTYSLYNSSVITCMGNDYGYEFIFSKPLEFMMKKGDMLIAISSSGNSANIINAAEVARSHSAKLITFTEFKPDNKLRHMGDLNVYVPCDKYGIVESIHNLILQEIVDLMMEGNSRTDEKDN